jgi:hypothetical protein
MTHLAARPLAVLSALRAERGTPTLTVRLSVLCATDLVLRKQTQIFLENADDTSHYCVMGVGDAVRQAGDRPLAVDRKSRSALDLRVASSRCEITRDERTDHNSTKARTEESHANGRNFTVYFDSVEHTMIGNLPIANVKHHRFSENFHAKYRKSVAVAPILHNCAQDRRAQHSDSTHDGGWGGLRNRGVTPNERSGR